MVSLWLRIGDGSDYEAHGDDLQSACDAMAALGVRPPCHWFKGGFETDEFPRNNHISLYYGDRESNFAHDLDKDERAEVERLLEGLAKEYRT